MGLIPGQGTKIPQATPHRQSKNGEKNTWKKKKKQTLRSILYSIKIFAYLLYARYYHKRARYYHNHSKDIGRTQWSSSFHGTESHLPKLSNQHKYLNVQY